MALWDSQRNREMHQREDRARHDVQRLPAELLTEGCCDEWRYSKPECVHRQSDGSLELGAVQVFDHARETHVVRRCTGGYTIASAM